MSRTEEQRPKSRDREGRDNESRDREDRDNEKAETMIAEPAERAKVATKTERDRDTRSECRLENKVSREK